MQLSLIQNKIFEIMGQKVMLDFDLAEMYEVETKSLKNSITKILKKFITPQIF